MIDAVESDWPEHVEELSRKTMETLENWAKLNDAGAKSDAAFLLVVSVLWDVTSGLVRQDVSRVLEAVHKELLVKVARAK